MRILGAVATCLLAASPLLAQGRLIDEGTLTITQQGVPAGREAFRIARVPSATGDLYRATGQVSLGTRRISPSLTTDTLGAPVSYDVGVNDGTPTVERLQARTRPGRFSAVLQTAHGESAKEYVIPERTVVLDANVYHQYFFLGLLGDGGHVTVLAPLARSESTATVQRRGTESIDIAGRPVTATRFVLTSPEHPDREFWLDSAGRLLRVSIPGRGILAQRDELPR